MFRRFWRWLVTGQPERPASAASHLDVMTSPKFPGCQDQPMAIDLTDEILIPARRDRVYAALNHVGTLKATIPGCEELIRRSASELEAKVVLKIGPVKARFGGKVTLDMANAPGGFSLSGEGSGEGSGGIAGFAKGGAVVVLGDRGAESLLRYTARADVGGKIAQLGSRLIAGTAKRLAEQFFATFAAKVTRAEAVDPS